MSLGLLVLGSLIGFAAMVTVIATGSPIWMALLTLSVIGNSVIFAAMLAPEPAKAKVSVKT